MASFTLKGTPFQTSGDLPRTGSFAPDFVMTKDDLTEIRLSDCQDKKVVLNIFPSLDTSTCAAAMKTFNQLAEKHKNVMFLCISADLPFAQKRFCTAEHLNNVIPVSIFRNPEFGQHYGLLIENGPLSGLLARAVIVLDETGKIAYQELVSEITNEPNYRSAEAALA
jgi:thiol peroxidase